MSTELKVRMQNSLQSKGLDYDALDSADTPLARAILTTLMEQIRVEDRVGRLSQTVTVHLRDLEHQITSCRTDHGHAAGALLARAGDIVELMAARDGYSRALTDLTTVYKSQPTSK